MPMTYVEALSRFHQNSIDAIKLAQEAQLTTLRAARELVAPRDVADLTWTLSGRFLAQQARYAEALIGVLAGAAHAATVASPAAEPPTPTPVAPPAPATETAHDDIVAVAAFGVLPTPQAVIEAALSEPHAVPFAVETPAPRRNARKKTS